MNNIVLLNDDENSNTPKLNLDELYEYKKQCDKNTLRSYNIVLQRIHTRIKTTSRQKNNDQFCWFVIPEVMIGVPKYDVSACISSTQRSYNDSSSSCIFENKFRNTF